MIEIKNLTINVKNNHILKDINYNFQNGKVYGLLGANGAGKTTLFKSIINVLSYSGKINVTEDYKKIGHLIESPAFYKNLTCLENLKMHADYKELEMKKNELMKYLNLVDLENAKDKKFKLLSMGMKQRLGIARALIGDTNTVLLDEPSNGLDPNGIRSIRSIISQHVKSKERITIISSHILNEISEFTDIFVFINDGKIVANIKNNKTSYAILKKTHNISIDYTSYPDYKGVFSVINDGENDYIISDYKTLKNFSNSNVEELNLEELYMNVMSLNAREVILK